MASIQDKINQYRGVGGTLQETSQEELQTLAGKAGLQAQPTDPISAATIGANPNQAKMAASPQVQQSAARLSQMDPSQGLATAAREAQARTQSTDKEQASKEKAEQLKNLGDTGKRVQSAIDTEIQKLSATAPVAATADTTNPIIQGAANKASLVANLQALAKDPTNQDLVRRVNADAGRGVGNLLSADELQGLYSSPEVAVAGAAKAVPDQLTVGALASKPDFGFSLPDLGNLLGVDPTALQGYTIPQLSDAVAKLQQDEFSRSQQLQGQSTSGNLGTAERATARDLGKEASATGVRASEADMARLHDSITNADQVSFGGQVYSVEDLLGSDKVSDIVSQYLSSPEGSPTQDQLKQTEPGLVKWIESNKAALSDAAAQMTKGTQTFASTQQANQSLGTYGGSQLSPEFLSNLIPGYGSLSNGALDTTKVPLLQQLGSLSPEKAKVAVDTINTLSPDLQKELKGFSPSEIAAMRLDMGVDSPVLKALHESQLSNEKIQAVDPNDENAVYSLFMGQGTTAKDLQKQLNDKQSAAALFGATYGTAGGLDMDRDGKLDSPASILDRIKKGTASPTLKDALAGKNPSLATSTMRPIDETSWSPTQKSAFDALSKYASDGVISAKDLTASGVAGNDELLRSIVGHMDPGSQGAVQAAIQKNVGTRTQGLLSSYAPEKDITKSIAKIGSGNVSALTALSRDLRDRYNALTKKAASYPKGYLTDSDIQKEVSMLKSQEAQIDAVVKKTQTALALSKQKADEAAKKAVPAPVAPASAGGKAVQDRVQDFISNPGQTSANELSRVGANVSDAGKSVGSKISKAWKKL